MLEVQEVAELVRLGLHIPLGNSVLFRADGRYHYAIQNSFDDNTIAVNSLNSWKQNELQIYAGLTFGGRW
jgi:hypothetical protein